MEALNSTIIEAQRKVLRAEFMNDGQKIAMIIDLERERVRYERAFFRIENRLITVLERVEEEVRIHS
jgi:hypothetical protein